MEAPATIPIVEPVELLLLVVFPEELLLDKAIAETDELDFESELEFELVLLLLISVPFLSSETNILDWLLETGLDVEIDEEEDAEEEVLVELISTVLDLLLSCETLEGDEAVVDVPLDTLGLSLESVWLAVVLLDSLLGVALLAELVDTLDDDLLVELVEALTTLLDDFPAELVDTLDEDLLAELVEALAALLDLLLKS